jgi:oxalate decarboxylase/phosphoglucose isomerase-like protein (cupin superfamily)
MSNSRFVLSTSYKVVKDDERYRLLDFDIPEIEPATISLTELKRGKATRGHSHPSPEVYLFLSHAVLELGKEEGATRKRRVAPGQMVLVKPDEFHRVWTRPESAARFVSMFVGGRGERMAKYAERDS